MPIKATAEAKCHATSRVSEHQKVAHVHYMIGKSPCDGCRLTRTDLDSTIFVITSTNPDRNCIISPVPVASDTPVEQA